MINVMMFCLIFVPIAIILIASLICCKIINDKILKSIEKICYYHKMKYDTQFYNEIDKLIKYL